MKEFLDFSKDVASQASEIMLQYFQIGVDAVEKNDRSIVTEADKKINQLVIDEVNRNFPDHSVLGEEASKPNESEYVWVCDPIDGTLPFSKGLPYSVFSLALCKKGVPVVGVVSDPFTNRLYSAVKGEGALLNNTPIKVSSSSLDYSSTINVDWWPEAEYDIDTICHKVSLEKSCYVLHLGCVVQASMMVACGQFEASIFPGTKGKNVDIAAVKIIVEEAGGKVTDLFGNEQRYDKDIKGALITNGVMHEEILKFIEL